MLSFEDIDNIINTNWKKHKGMNNLLEVKGVLRKLVEVLNNNIEGDIVELGCNNGGTSYWIQLILKLYKSDKKFYVYDSWEGIPHKTDRDKLTKENAEEQMGGDNKIRSIKRQIEINSNFWKKGVCQTSLHSFINTFQTNNTGESIVFNGITIDKIEIPIIKSGWFKNIPDKDYPEKICFAFFDGDLYSSIIDSFNKVYHKCQKGAIIVIDDCGDNTLIGVKNACNDFLSNKPEDIHLDAYPDINGNWNRKNNLNTCYWGGWILKL
tara:strand:- start:109 stop:906 length:798 start_codon:yes stop_codon:yes gene_type:complete